MKYQSTLGSEERCSFEDVLLNAYAKDGGLYLPESIPELSLDRLNSWASLGYVQLTKKIVQEFVDAEEYSNLQLNDLITKAFKTFDCEEIIPIKKLDNICVAELWHGRSLAFKDLAVTCLSYFTENYFAKRGIHANVICATSGDTGGSVMEAAKGCKFIDIFTLLPEGRCSEIQERQMTCISEENVHALCAQGSSDDFDTVVRELFADDKFSSEHKLISFSSLNWVRLMIQIVHYFYSYFQSVDKIGNNVTVVVPCGGLGNLTAGYIAHLMGLPIQLVAATNQNDSSHRIFCNGDFSKPSQILQSSSCSMDITVPLNIERILFLASGRNSQKVLQLMNDFKRNKKVTIPKDILLNMRKAIQSSSVPEFCVREVIKEVWENYNYHIDPHTAVAMAISLHPQRFNILLESDRIVCLSSASPQKFPEIFIEEKIPFEMSESIKLLLKKPTRFQHLKKSDDWVQIVKDGIIAASEKFKTTF
eukprot:gene7969-8828_t